MPPSKPLRSRRILAAFRRDPLRENSQRSSSVDENTVLASLRELVSAGTHRLDPMLAAIADAARQLTGASGAALAMWKDGAMVCRAHSGDTAPPLGAKLNAETGISGECLRSGKVQNCADTENHPLVDLEVCRRLGLRSIAVLPIQGWRGINGILEVFSTNPAAFSEQHLTVLEQLAALAERARAAQPHGASSLATNRATAVQTPQISGLLPASDRVGDVVLASMGARSRPFVLAVVGLVAITLLALMVWLGWRGPDTADAKAQASAPPAASRPVNAAASGAAPMQRSGAHPPDPHFVDNDRVWKANPGGETLFSSDGRPSAGIPVTFASKVDVISSQGTQDQSQSNRSPANRSSALTGETAKFVANASANVALPHGEFADPNPNSVEIASAEPPSVTAGSPNPSALNGVLSSSVGLPGLSAPVSQGVSGGQLVSRVEPVYPAQARLLRQQGTVTLSAMVAEDGRVRDVKVVQGSPVLANAAAGAVKRWRYKPFRLDGKPVKNEVRVTIDFNLPTN